MHKTLIHNFVKRLDSLITLTNHFNATPIFITQVEYNGLAREELFLINQTLKKYCNNKNIFLIELDNIINASNKDFFDKYHTTIHGSKKIAKSIYPDLNKILRSLKFE